MKVEFGSNNGKRNVSLTSENYYEAAMLAQLTSVINQDQRGGVARPSDEIVNGVRRIDAVLTVEEL